MLNSNNRLQGDTVGLPHTHSQLFSQDHLSSVVYFINLPAVGGEERWELGVILLAARYTSALFTVEFIFRNCIYNLNLTLSFTVYTFILLL